MTLLPQVLQKKCVLQSDEAGTIQDKLRLYHTSIGQISTVHHDCQDLLRLVASLLGGLNSI